LLLLSDSRPRNAPGQNMDGAKGKLRRNDPLRSNLEMAGRKLCSTDARSAEYAANKWNRNIRGHGLGSNRCTPDSAEDKANPPASLNARQKIDHVRVPCCTTLQNHVAIRQELRGLERISKTLGSPSPASDRSFLKVGAIQEAAKLSAPHRSPFLPSDGFVCVPHRRE
jgi:hypothetical protein